MTVADGPVDVPVCALHTTMATERPLTERAVLLVAALALLAGVAGSAWVATSASTPDRPQFDDDVADRYDAIQGVEGNRTTTIERNGTVESTRTYAVQMRPGTGEKHLSLREGPESTFGTRVSNGSVLWLYERETPNVTRIELDADRKSTRGERLARLFARLNATTGDAETPAEPPTVEPLPVVPASAVQSDAATGAGGGPLAVSYDGTATVADREVYVLRLTPVDETSDANYEQTLWLDAEHLFPLKQRTAWTHEGQRTVQTTTYTDVAFDPGLADDRFTPDIPANATVHSPDTAETTTYQSVGALREASDVAVPAPDVPPTYELTYATRTDGRVQGVGLRYANRTSVVTVAKYSFTYADEDNEGEVTIDGRPATLTTGHRLSLSWNCEDYRYTVRGTGISADAVVDVGESVGCPDDGGR